MHRSEQSNSIPSLIKRESSAALKYRGNNEFYGIADARECNAIALKFVTSIGEQKAIHYHDIISPMDFNGTNSITLMTTRMVVTIRGGHLEKLFDHIIQHQVLWIKEPQSSFSTSEGKDVYVSSIDFEMMQ